MSEVVVIGSGLGGLTCAYILQKNGYKVTVLEQQAQAGGCLQCFMRGGVKFETGMHFIGSARADQTMGMLMRYFGLDRDVHLSSLDPEAYNIVSLAGEKFRFPTGREAFLERMGEYFPSQKDNLKRYLEIVNRVSSASALSSLLSDSRDLAAGTEYQLRAMDEVLDELFTDPMLANVLAGDLSLYAAERGRTPFSQHAFIMDFYNQSSFRIAGGSDAIAKSLIAGIRGMGGEVLTRKKVVRINCDSIRATSVETSDECLYKADYIVSTIHPARLMELLDTRLIRPAFRSRISSIPQTSGVFALYLKFKDGTLPYMNTNFFGYAGSSPWGCESHTFDQWPKGYLYMHHCHKPDPQWAEAGVVLSYMSMEDVARWKGTPAGRRGEEYAEFKRIHAEKLMARVEKDCPGFIPAVDSYWTSTPLTYQDYTGTEGGSIYGVAKDISLGVAGRVPYRTKIPNLLLAGQNTNSHGILGVMVGTILTCGNIVGEDVLWKQLKSVH
ncbi:MAG: phytoene desaturase family protein [Candidatus Cryptobacteroides sp.]